jgi:hypothetical protein
MWFLILNSTACSISNKISVSGLSGFRSNKLHLHILLGVNFEINLLLASKIFSSELLINESSCTRTLCSTVLRSGGSISIVIDSSFVLSVKRKIFDQNKI